MSEFRVELERAKSRQRLFIGMAVGVFGLAGLALVLALSVLTATKIQVEPAEAAGGAAVNIVSGAGLVFGDTVYGIGQSYDVKVDANGFVSANVTVTGEDKGRTVRVVLRPLPGQFTATIDPAVENARWSLNGQRVAKGTSLEITLEAGAYDLKIDHPHYQVVEQRINVSRGETLEEAFVLEAVSGQATVQSVPDGAMVSVDGKPVGTTPLEFPLKGGTHEVTVSHPGFQATNETVEITRALPDIRRNYRLRRASAALKLSVSPSGGDLLIGGRKVALDKQISLPAGIDHEVSYFKDGYAPHKEVVKLKPGENKAVSVKLRPLMGQLEVSSTPPGNLTLDGKPAGITPFVSDLLSVPYRVSVSRPGYRTATQTIRPTAGKRTTVNIRLVPEIDARLTEARPQYKNSLGMELKLFRPAGKFTMGAPRSEPGQRANEFLRDVELTRPFYAGVQEVTRGQFATFNPKFGGGRLDHPATGVTWVEAALFTNWLSKRERLQPFYQVRGKEVVGLNTNSDGYRLLSEAEWEWLARRAGQAATTIFPWGDEAKVPPKAGNISDEAARGVTATYVPGYTDGFPRTAPVGSFQKNNAGLHDLFGNVAEWVSDAYSLVPPKKGYIARDPIGPATGERFVVKGSSWKSGQRSTLRSAYRTGASGARDDVGFRIGRYLAPEAVAQ